MSSIVLDKSENENITRQLSVYKHIKKKAANDAQLLMYEKQYVYIILFVFL